MSDAAEIDTLRQFPGFDRLTDAEAARLLPHLYRIHVEAGGHLFRPGDAADAIYLVLSGRVVIRTVIDGESRQLGPVLGPGAVFGEVATLLGQRRTAEARAEEDASLWRLAAAMVDSGAERGESWAAKVLLGISSGLARRLTEVDREVAKLLADLHQRWEAEAGESPSTEPPSIDHVFASWSVWSV